MNGFHPSWATLPLAQLASEMCLGKMLDKEKNRGTLQPYLRNVNVRWFGFDLEDLKEMRFEENESERFGLRPNDLVVCEGGEPGRAAVWNGQTASVLIQKALHRIRFNEDHFDPHFAAYYLYFGRLANRFSHLYTGTTISHLTGKAIRRIIFPLPPLNEQRRIVAKLDEQFSDLDVAICTLQRVKAKLKRYRAAVLKAAIDGKLTTEWRRRHPTTEPATALLERILAERRRRWENAQQAKFIAAARIPPANWQERYGEPKSPVAADLSPLPKEWTWTSVEQLLVEPSCNGISVKGADSPPGVPALRLSAMADNGFDYSARRYIPISNDVADRLAILLDDFFVSRGNGSIHLVGRGTLAQSPPMQIVFPDTMIRLRFAPMDGLCHFVRLVWQSKWIRSQVEAKARTTAGIYKISQADIDGFAIPLPPLAEQVAIVAEVEARLSVVDAVTAQVDANLKRAGRLRQGILKRAFEGKLVPQVATDEPATVLLERIRQKRLAAPQKPARKPVGGKLVRAVLENLGRAIAYCLSRAKKPHGRTWLAKVLAIGELHVGIPFKQRHGKYPHGPFDDVIYKAERVGRKAGWFDFTEQKKAKEQTSYLVTAGTPAAAALSAEFFGDHKAKFDELLGHFDDLNSDETELFATVYVAWNDLLLDGRPADEDAIVAEFYAWDESKKKFSRDQILSRIAWMRQHGYVPAGRGQRTTVVEKKSKPPSGRKKQPRKA